MTREGSAPLWVVGAGGHAKVVVATALAVGWTEVALFDDAPVAPGRLIAGRAVSGAPPEALRWEAERAAGFVAIGSNQARLARAATLSAAQFAVLAHPSATIDPSVVLGRGTLVAAGAVINPDARIGEHAIVNTGAIVEHDCIVEDGAHIAPGAVLAGGVRVGRGAFVGAGAVVTPSVMIGAGAICGAGAAVVADVPPNTVVAGVPARALYPA